MKRILSIVTLALFLGAVSLPSMAQDPSKPKQKTEACCAHKKCSKIKGKKCCASKKEAPGCCDSKKDAPGCCKDKNHSK